MKNVYCLRTYQRNLAFGSLLSELWAVSFIPFTFVMSDQVTVLGKFGAGASCSVG